MFLLLLLTVPTLVTASFIIGDTIMDEPLLPFVSSTPPGPSSTWTAAAANISSPPACFNELPEAECLYLAERGFCFGMREVNVPGKKFGLDIGMAEDTLLLCRPMCRILYSQVHFELDPAVKEILIYAGGVDDDFIDLFGYRHHICDVHAGFTFQSRKKLVAWSREAFMSSKGRTDLSKRTKRAERYTKEGFKKSRVPKKLWGDLKDYYNWKKDRPRKWEKEDCEPGCSVCLATKYEDNGETSVLFKNESQYMLNIGLDLQKKVAYALWPLAEKWAGVELQVNNIYGIRRYTRGSWLAAHVDHIETHVISFILHLGHKVDTDWPLNIMDHDLRPHKVYLKSRDMVYYESSKLPHGRIEPLDGDYYDNLFVHFRLPMTEDNGEVAGEEEFIKAAAMFHRVEAFKNERKTPDEHLLEEGSKSMVDQD